MKYPTWEDFNSKYAGQKTTAFENLARMLFRHRYNIGESLPYFYNQAGNETSTIKVDDEFIGFQAKYFEKEIDASQIIHSIKQARKKNPTQTKIIVYTNQHFGNPRKGKDGKEGKKTKKQESIENIAESVGLQLEWMLDQNILDAVTKYELAYNFFFNPDVNLIHLDEDIKNSNALHFRVINDSFKIRETWYTLKRTTYVQKLSDLLTKGENVIISGESGNGKTALVKKYYATLNDNDTTFYYINSEAFDTDNLDKLFHLSHSYSLSSFINYYAGIKRKIILIDSAERILRINNAFPFRLFIKSLGEKGWQFIFTVKDHLETKLLELLNDNLSLHTETIYIKNLEDSELDSVLKQFKVAKPSDHNLYNRIHNLFYFARYTELSSSLPITYTEYRDKVWEMKIRGDKRYKAGLPDSREQTVLEIADRMLRTNLPYSDKNNLDYDTIATLVEDNVIVSNKYLGYYFAHDIYYDWALDIRLEQEWHRTQNVNDFISKVGGSLPIVNSFYRWFSDKIIQSNTLVSEFVEASFKEELKGRLTKSLFTAILKSRDYAYEFFNKYEERLLANDGKWLTKILRVLTTDCMDIQQFITYKENTFPIMVPNGSGWDAAIEFIYKYFERYSTKHYNIIFTTLENYVRKKPRVSEIYYKAGLMALSPHLKTAEARKKGKSSFFLENAKPFSRLTCQYSAGIINEFKDIINLVVDNKWINHSDPYYELMSYIVYAEDGEQLSLYPLYIGASKELESLMRIFWTGGEKEDSEYSKIYYIDTNEAWGMTHESIHDYFPASALQTGILPLLTFHPEETLKFIVDFINNKSNYYTSKNVYNSSFDVNDFVLPNGKHKQLIGNQDLWNIYRGTSSLSVPYLLQSIHMALEKFLLDNCAKEKHYDKDKDYDKALVKTMLDYILEHAESVSLISIVASVVTAYPYGFWDEAMCILGNLQFLKYDLTRYTQELGTLGIDFTYNNHPELLKERQTAKNMKHRQIHLESLLLSLQVQCVTSDDDVSKKRLSQLYLIVDSLKEQLKNEPKGTMLTTKYIISRCDYRSMKKEDVDINGISAIKLTPSLDKEQEKETNEMEKDIQENLRGVSLRNWSISRYRGELDKIKYYPYEKDPLAALKIAREIDSDIKEKPNKFYKFTGDEYIPSMVSAILIRDFKSLLSNEQYDYCINRIIADLSDVKSMVYSLSDYNILMDALGPIIIAKPSLWKKCKQLIIFYIRYKQQIGAYKACESVTATILDHDLWGKVPEFMKQTVKTLNEQDAYEDGDYEKTIEHAWSILGLVPIETKINDIDVLAEQSLETLSHLWEESQLTRYNEINIIRSNDCSYVIAKHILSSNPERCQRLIGYYARYILNDTYDIFLLPFIIITANSNNYESFWFVWHQLYDTIVLRGKHQHNIQQLNDYLLNPRQYTDWGDKWFGFKKENMKFYASIAHDIGSNPAVINAIGKNCCGIAKEWYMESIPILYDIVFNHPNLELGIYKDNVRFYLEQILQKVIQNKFTEVRNNIKFKSQIITILEFMENIGSPQAADMLKYIY